MAIEVMNRVESKYMITGETREKLLETIIGYTELDEYNRENEFYTISNIYYDTDDNNLIRTSLSKPKYKEKVRLRAYGVPCENDKVYLEIKKKFNGVVNKRRSTFKLNEAYEFIEARQLKEVKPYTNEQIVKEITYTLNQYNPQPKVYIAYDRQSYIGENGLRITFDKNIRTRRDNLCLEDGDYGEYLLPENLFLMEIKIEGVMPLWLARLLSENDVFQTSFSKYGTEYKKYLVNGGQEKCLTQSLKQQKQQQKQLRKQQQPLHGSHRSVQLV